MRTAAAVIAVVAVLLAAAAIVVLIVAAAAVSAFVSALLGVAEVAGTFRIAALTVLLAAFIAALMLAGSTLLLTGLGIFSVMALLTLLPLLAFGILVLGILRSLIVLSARVALFSVFILSARFVHCSAISFPCRFMFLFLFRFSFRSAFRLPFRLPFRFAVCLGISLGTPFKGCVEDALHLIIDAGKITGFNLMIF